MTTIHGFELIQERDIPEINTHARLYRHCKTGAELLSLENDDENKVFGINFFTPPTDSTGLPHIMEHSVLCGSRKYQVKEPFVELLKGSLQTFLNAFTYSDKTCYPVASQNVQDLYNLVDVYLDAVFYPRITPYTLKQEGWHYELDDIEEPMTFKGVVFNEMKGAYSDPDNLLARYVQQSLFPNNTYGVDSGGDPKEIPNLTFEQFQKFHQTYYHPSNARIFFYGDDQPEERLRILDEYLKDFESITITQKIEMHPAFEQPRRVTYPYPADDEGKGIVTVNWALNDTLETETVLAIHILRYILIGTPASPLRKALIESELGEDLAGVGLDSDLRQLYFSTGLKGIDLENSHQIETLIMNTLSQLVDEGIDQETIEAALNTIEFSLRENNTGSFPRGLALMINALGPWMHGGDPLEPLAFEAPLAAIKQHVSAGKYFEGLIRDYFINNTHRTVVLMEPDANLQEQDEAEERARLDQTRMSMSETEIRQVVEETHTLKQLQETPDSPDALATIPNLTLDDIDKQNKTIPLEIFDKEGAQVLYHDLFTNGIVYLDLGFNLYSLPQEYLPYISLFGRALLEMGTETEDFVKLSQRIGRKTGGIRPSSFTSAIRGVDRSAAWMFLRGKATVAQTEDMLNIMRDVLLTVKLDNQDRFRQLVLEEKAGEEAGLIPQGHIVVNTRLKSHFNEADWASERINGIHYLLFLRQLAEDIDRDWPSVYARLETIRQLLVNRSAMLCNVTLDQHNWDQIEPSMGAFLSEIPLYEPEFQTWQPPQDRINEGFAIPAQVNYVGKGANLYELGYQPHGSAAVIVNYLQTSWLWERVRVQGGAYGGFSTFDRRSGTFTYISYRDPNLVDTLAIYDQTPQFLRQLDVNREEIVKGIIGTIGTMDAYQLPDAKGFTSLVRYLTGDTDEVRQQLRDEVLSTTIDDFHRFADALDTISEKGLVVVLGSQSAMDAAEMDDLRTFKLM